jgi:hypothetical protein
MRIGSWSLRGLSAVLAAAALPACGAIRTAGQSDTGATSDYETASQAQVRSCQAEAYRRLPGTRADDIAVDPHVRETSSDAVLLDWASRQSDERGTCLVSRNGDIERFEIAGGGHDDDYGYAEGGYAASSRQLDACRDEAERRLTGVRPGDIAVSSRVRDERDGVVTLDWSVRQSNDYGTCAVDRDGRVRNFAFGNAGNNGGYGYATGNEQSRARDACRRHAESRDMDIVRLGNAELQNDRTYRVIVTVKAFGTESPYVCTYDPSRGIASMPGDG